MLGSVVTGFRLRLLQQKTELTKNGTVLSLLGIRYTHTSVNHPGANGAVERMNDTIKSMLTAHFDDYPHDWTSASPHIRNACRSKPHP
jgi:hypothetical protein